MQSNNPVFRSNPSFGGRGRVASPDLSPAELEALYASPSATAAQTGRMTVDDVVMRTGIIFVVLLAAAAIGWQAQSPVLLFVGLFGGLALGLVNSFKRQVSPPLVLTYAALEGLFLGTLSSVLGAAYPGIVQQAMLGTFAAFGGMLIAYRSGKLRATPKFTKMLMIAGMGYFAVAMVSFITAMFGVGGGWGFYGAGPLGVLLAVAGVGLASLFLVLDFDMIEQGVRRGLPERESWRAAFGLTVTLIWVYVEILRLLAILRNQ